MIPLISLISLIVLPIGALIFLGLALYLRGQWWWSLLSGLLWFLFGFYSIQSTAIFYYQREIAVVWIVIGIAVFWMPAYYKKSKEPKTLQEMAAAADNEGEEDEEDKVDSEIRRLRMRRWRTMRGRGEVE